MENLHHPRCDYIPMWSTSEKRCRRTAAVRVFRSHGAGENPVYKERCMAHASFELGPGIAAWWDDERGGWGPTD